MKKIMIITLAILCKPAFVSAMQSNTPEQQKKLYKQVINALEHDDEKTIAELDKIIKNINKKQITKPAPKKPLAKL